MRLPEGDRHSLHLLALPERFGRLLLRRVHSSMTVSSSAINWEPDHSRQAALLKGEILLETRPYSAWGGAVTAQMYVPLARSLTWQQLTDYPRWVQYFPDLIRSEVLSRGDGLNQSSKCLYQAASKAFLFFTAQVEIYVRVFEVVQQQIQFRLERGSFLDFSSDIKLLDWRSGTVLIYSVQATPTIPIPSLFIEQAMQLDLPNNMRRMRQVICEG